MEQQKHQRHWGTSGITGIVSQGINKTNTTNANVEVNHNVDNKSPHMLCLSKAALVDKLHRNQDSYCFIHSFVHGFV